MSAGGSGSPERVATTGRQPLSRPLVLTLQIGVFVALMAAWEFAVATGKLDPFFFSRPSDIAARIVQWLRTGSIWPRDRRMTTGRRVCPDF